jgi:hypothetical protein
MYTPSNTIETIIIEISRVTLQRVLAILTNDLEWTRKTHDEVRNSVREKNCLATDQVDNLTRVEIFLWCHCKGLAIHEKRDKRPKLSKALLKVMIL